MTPRIDHSRIKNGVDTCLPKYPRFFIPNQSNKAENLKSLVPVILGQIVTQEERNGIKIIEQNLSVKNDQGKVLKRLKTGDRQTLAELSGGKLGYIQLEHKPENKDKKAQRIIYFYLVPGDYLTKEMEVKKKKFETLAIVIAIDMCKGKYGDTSIKVITHNSFKFK